MEIVAGYNKHTKYKIPWKTSNGVLVAGQSGSGKSTYIAWILSQYAYKGARIIVCDYGASIETEDTLLNKVSHLNRAIIRTATTTNDIDQAIKFVRDIGEKRYNGTDKDRTPIIVCIDECAAYILDSSGTSKKNIRVEGNRRSLEGETVTTDVDNVLLRDLFQSIIRYRKVEIHFILASQNWTQLGTNGTKAIRNALSEKVFLRTSLDELALFGLTDKSHKDILNRLRIGMVYYLGSLYEPTVLAWPKLSDSMITEVEQKLATMEYTYDDVSWRDDSFLQMMFDKYGTMVKRQQEDLLTYRQDEVLSSLDIESKEDLLALLIRLGKSNSWIISVVKGRTSDINRLLTEMKGSDNAE